MPTQNQIREAVTNKIIAAFGQDLLPWRRPWTMSANAGHPVNVVSQKPYTGVNPLLLEIARIDHGLESRWWGTFKQWEQIGCRVLKRPDHIKPGEWGTKIVFCKRVKKTVEDPDCGEEQEKEFFLLRYYTVFNAEQVAGAEQYHAEVEPQQICEPDFQPAEELIVATEADIRHGGNRAYYDLAGDYIRLPHRERFGTLGTYYETAFHELSHWAEHPTRLNWDRKNEGYAMGELVAEMSACYVAAEIGIPHGEALENHASYLKSWMGGMKGDSAFIFRAAKMASKTTDFLLSFVREPALVV